MSKAEKEAFVTGLDGTSPGEILLVLSCIPVGVACFQCVMTLLRPTSDFPLVTILSEVFIIWIPMVLCQSNLLYSKGIPYLVLELVFIFVCEATRLLRQSPSKYESGDDASNTRESQITIRKILTVYRSSLFYLTFVAILAVDFHVFPRRFAKTETSGFSVMDLGAASFSVAAGLVSTRARSKPTNLGLDVRKTLPLVFLGAARLLTHKELEYQEHVSEYGVHWNFPFTLAILSPVAVLLPGPSWILPTLIMTLYQTLLSCGLQTWIEQAPRSFSQEDGWIHYLFVANREGILGCIGYCCLYLVSEWIGYRYLWDREKGLVFKDFFAPLFALGSVLGVLQVGGVAVSRRSTNLAFCTWVLLVNSLILLGIKLGYRRNDAQTPIILGLVNKQGLGCFVGANLMTGLVNLSVDTLDQSDSKAMVILMIYLSAVGSLAKVLNLIAPRNKHPRDKLKSR